MCVLSRSVADWLAASDPGPQLTSSDYPGPALTFDLHCLGVKKPETRELAVFLMPATHCSLPPPVKDVKHGHDRRV